MTLGLGSVELVAPGVVEVPVRLDVEVLRERRDRCAVCRSRRVLYRIYVGSGPHADKTEARCAPCWGIRSA